MADKDLGKLLGGSGSKRIPWQLKVGVLAVLELVLWAVTLDLGLWLVLSVFMWGIGWACFIDTGNILMTLAVLVFATLLVGTAFGEPMRAVANGVKGFGDTGSKSVGDLDLQLPSSGSTPVTTVAPAPAPAPTAPAQP